MQAKTERTSGSHVPLRTCVVCRGRFEKGLLTRYVCPATATTGAGLVRDTDNRTPGRGFYHCQSEACGRKFPAFAGWRKKCKGEENVQTQGA